MMDDEEATDAFVSYCRITTIEKGENIWVPGSGKDSTTLLLEGVLKTFILGPDGTENIFTFWHEPGTFICPTADMIDIPEIWCQAVTPCTIIEMVGMNPYRLAEEYPVMWKEIMFGTLPFAVRIMNKARVGYTMTAKERYLWFLENYGPVVDKVPLSEIALYLGIQPQSLSRIRTELAEQGIVTPQKS